MNNKQKIKNRHREEFIRKYCVKRLADKIRWRRGVFFDDTEQIEKFLETLDNALEIEITKALEEQKKEIIDKIENMAIEHAGNSAKTVDQIIKFLK